MTTSIRTGADTIEYSGESRPCQEEGNKNMTPEQEAYHWDRIFEALAGFVLEPDSPETAAGEGRAELTFWGIVGPLPVAGRKERSILAERIAKH